jgi:hypothetical protein
MHQVAPSHVASVTFVAGFRSCKRARKGEPDEDHGLQHFRLCLALRGCGILFKSSRLSASWTCACFASVTAPCLLCFVVVVDVDDGVQR